MAAQGSPWKFLPSSWLTDGLGLPQQQKVTDRAGWILYSLESEVHDGEAMEDRHVVIFIINTDVPD
ncbi:hypothetical protein N7491_004252 [Penicillium cf. griseofulvum]|uniref:Uncharacterized protein n=1 Tax=Penicillium cf. griseofulvum TaxID=2972120 RepID=A0A9W9MPH8_9EURO|nr:hypothetical protein N7472_001572 [Penicillium cf. griseofulvum]KAJ5437719.1 hypothetical protein N7445_006263 [Penicillium cf. griseofulvum]KAJ5441846.1 hypothetical protein N7491_004252 [Penicillium cf. griseofulvum]